MFAVLNFISFVLPNIICLSIFKSVKQMYENPKTHVGVYVPEFSSFLIISLFGTSASIIMITITTAKSLKLYHSRAAMDTLGCLPLSYGERFWGDFLSGLSANLISAVPMAVIGLCINNAMRSIMDSVASLDKYSLLEEFQNLPHFLNMLIITYLITYIGVYAVTTLVSSCTGKLGSAVIFSLMTMIVIPGLYMSFGAFFFSRILGAEPAVETSQHIGAIPPFGSIFALLIVMFTDGANLLDMKLGVELTDCLIIMLLITAAYIVGAYLLGKYRKAEKTGKSFAYNSAFTVVTLMLCAMIFMMFAENLISGNILAKLFVAAVTFLAFFALNYSQYKRLKGFWKQALKFAGTFAVCFAFIIVVDNTKAFGLSKKLPDRSKIDEVHISAITSFRDEYTFRSDEAIDTILKEHKKLLEYDLEAGNNVTITYITGGRKFQRSYGYYSEDKGSVNPIEAFGNEISKLTPYIKPDLGLLESADFSDIDAMFEYFGDNRRDDAFDGKPEGRLKTEKLPELAELLKYDIENNSKAQNGIAYLRLQSRTSWQNGYFEIQKSYEKTLEFLMNPDIYQNSDDDNDTEKCYFFSYYPDDGETQINLEVSTSSGSEALEELLKYVEIQKENSDVYSEDFLVFDTNGGTIKYGVLRENEQAAVKALARLFREMYAN